MSQLRTRITQKIYCGVEQLGARRAHNPKVTGSSPVPATKDDSSVFLSVSLFFDPLYPLSNVGYKKIEIEFYLFDIQQKRLSE